MTKITVKCGWCGKELGEKDGQGVEGDNHGICDDCLNHYFPHHADKIRGILEVEKVEEFYLTKEE